MIKTNTLPDIYDKKKNKEEKIKKRLKKNDYYVHKETENVSFLKMYRLMSSLGIENNDFFLALYDTRLIGVDPYDEDLPLEYKIMILQECKRNYWYFIREVVRIPVSGADIGSGKPYTLHRGNLALSWCLLNNINFFIELPRQNFKTVSIAVAMLWLYNFGTNNSKMMLIHKDHRGAKDNLATIKSVRDVLPEYLRFDHKFNAEGKEMKLSQNVEDAHNPKNNNTIVTLASATSVERADLLGRGATQAIQNYDEFGFLRFNKTIYESASPAAQQAAIEAEENHKPHCKMISTTPGDMNTQYGKDAKEFRDKCCEFKEEYYDWDVEEARDYMRANSDTDFFRISFSYRQLGRSEQYFADVKKALGGNFFKVRREILLEWLIVNDDPIFEETALANLVEMAKNRKVEKTIYIDKLYRFDLYEMPNPMEPCILSCDVASGTGRDSSTIVLINSKTKAVMGEFKNNSIDTTAFSYVIYKIAKEIAKNCMIVIERNNVGVVVIQNLLKTDIKSRLYFEDNKKDHQEKIKNGRLSESSNDVHNYGLWTDEYKKAQMHEYLVKYVNYYGSRLATKGMAEEIEALIYNKRREIDHPPDGHDDLVMAYLIGIWVYWYGKNISRFGIYSVKDIDPSSNMSEEEAIMEQMQEEEEREEQYKEIYEKINSTVSGKRVEDQTYKTMKDLYDELDAESYQGNNKSNQDLINIMGGNRQSGLNKSNLFNRGSRSEADTFGNNLLNNILGRDL
jgi:hypothetical protein